MKHRAILGAVAAVFLLLTSGCYRVSVMSANMPPAETHRVWMHGFVYGLIGSEVSSTTVCGDRPVFKVETFHSVPNYLVSWLTAGIYTPMTVQITCAATTNQ